MTASPLTIGPEESLEDGVNAMAKHNIRRLPVVEDGRLIGIVSRSDLIRTLFRKVLGEYRAPLQDAEIAAAILQEVEGQDWAPRGTLAVSVTNGVVEFSGVTTNAGAPRALKVIAENIPGVKRVVDHLIWVDPYSGMALPSSDESTTPASAT